MMTDFRFLETGDNASAGDNDAGKVTRELWKGEADRAKEELKQ